MDPSEPTHTSLGLFSSFPSKWEASTTRSPPVVSMISDEVTCSHTIRLRSAS